MHVVLSSLTALIIITNLTNYSLHRSSILYTPVLQNCYPMKFEKLCALYILLQLLLPALQAVILSNIPYCKYATAAVKFC